MSNAAKWRSVWSAVALFGLVIMVGPLWQIPFDFVIYNSAGNYRQYDHLPWRPETLENFRSWLSDSRFIGIPLLLSGLIACTFSLLAPGSRPRVHFRVGRCFVAVVAMLACAGAALFIPPSWSGVSGRDFRPQATTMALLIILLAMLLRWGRRWDIWDFWFGALGSEVVTLLTISHFSGFTWLELFHWFNMHWLFFMSVFTVVPWFLGFGLGSVPRLWRGGGILRNAQQDAAPNGGPATLSGNSGVSEGPPSVS